MPDAASNPLAVAYSVEQCWHRVPGGTAVADLRVARELAGPDFDDVELRFVAGKHPTPPPVAYRPVGEVAMLPLTPPLLYEAWTRLNWPRVEAVTGPGDVVHATGLFPCATKAPLAVTGHDLAFLHTPERFTRHGAASMKRARRAIRRRAEAVIVSSRATLADAIDAGFDESQLRLVPLGVDTGPATAAEIASARRAHAVPSEFVLFVGTVEPRKNLRRLVAALASLDDAPPLVVAGAAGWGDEVTDVAALADDAGHDVRFLGFVTDAELRGLYASATIVAYPSEREGFGLPVAEALAQGAAVVTSRWTATEVVAGGSAVLFVPRDGDDFAHGVETAMRRRDELSGPARRRAAELDWATTAHATAAVYRELAS